MARTSHDKHDKRKKGVGYHELCIDGHDSETVEHAAYALLLYVLKYLNVIAFSQRLRFT